ncbi:MAG TPA: VOC family protein [Candidatus Eisenbacteria bacterium]|nr:VOC family protein [Candidatus Eisenbacteria bacterium]
MRYLVSDLDRAVEFYTKQLGFAPAERWGSAFAAVVRGNTNLWLSGPGTSAWQPMPDGRTPEPGGWNRIAIPVDDLEADVKRMRAAGVVFRNEIVTGPGGKQILAEDGCGNVVELFEHAKR